MSTEVEDDVRQDEQDLEALRMRNVRELGLFSFELEEKREQSILNQAGQMLTAFSLFSAAILMSYPLVADYTNVPDGQAFCLSFVVLIPLIVSLVLAILAQWRFKYETMKDADILESEIRRNQKDYKGQADYDSQWLSQLTAVQRSKTANNDKRVKLIKASMICFLVSVCILVIGNVLFFLFYA